MSPLNLFLNGRLRAAVLLAADFVFESDRGPQCDRRRTRAPSKSSVDLLLPAHDICVLVQQAEVRNAREVSRAKRAFSASLDVADPNDSVGAKLDKLT